MTKHAESATSERTGRRLTKKATALELAVVLFDTLKSQNPKLNVVSGRPDGDGELALLDGEFDLEAAADALLGAICERIES
jgi:hypothetical protein